MKTDLWERLVTEPKDKVWKKGCKVSAAQHSLKPWLRVASDWGSWNNKDRAWKMRSQLRYVSVKILQRNRPVEAKRFQRIDLGLSGRLASSIFVMRLGCCGFWVVPIAIISSFSEIPKLFFFFFLKTFPLTG